MYIKDRKIGEYFYIITFNFDVKDYQITYYEKINNNNNLRYASSTNTISLAIGYHNYITYDNLYECYEMIDKHNTSLLYKTHNIKVINKYDIPRYKNR